MHDMKSKVLLVDDDATLLEALDLYLSRHGYQVYTAANGDAALHQISRHGPDIVVLDVMMPQLDGWQTCRHIRQTSSIPIIMLTARAQETDKAMGVKLGVDDYVTKPFSLKELKARIEAILVSRS
ncbi:MAG: response regulator [Chloroflexi bacterium]|nr:response regulator [Chloroflexota bacterium]